MRAISLMYHDVVDQRDWDSSGFPGPWAAAYKLDRAAFQSHLEAIDRAAASTPRPPADAYRDWSGARPLFLTFDDAGSSALTIIAPMLEAIRCPGHFFVPTDYIGKPGFLDAAGLIELRRRGHVIGSHSCSHPMRMAACSRQQLLDEWRRSLDVLSSILGEAVTLASVPGGYYSRAVGETAVEAGVRILFTSEPTTRVNRLGECLLPGRFAIFRSTPATAAARYARGHLPTLWKDSLWWNAKKVAKTLGGRAYVAGAEWLRRQG